ncbi:MAG: hypothetical protein HFJ52_00090 [Clostridia bacterium]|nr:hypothetical protein [Clostridia bacterium]
MVNWQDGTKISDAHVNEDGTITEAVYEGDTPLSAYNLNLMQQIDTKSLTIPKNTTLTNNYEVILPLKYQIRKQFATNLLVWTSTSQRHRLCRSTAMKEN